MKKLQYTPSLRVSPGMSIFRDRKLPIPGEVRVKAGDRVSGENVVASADLPGKIINLKAASILGCEPGEIEEFLKRRRGDKVSKGESIGETPGMLGFFKRELISPSDGTIESISKVTGQIFIREASSPVELNAYFDGMICRIFPGEGARVSAEACFIQGIFGIGPEAIGKLCILGTDTSNLVGGSGIKAENQGTIVVSGAWVTAGVLREAVKYGVKGIISGGIDASDLLEFYGKPFWGITGNESLGVTIIITEGFGQISMAKKTFSLLKSHEGQKVSIDGATQIRAGVIRPEIIIPILPVCSDLSHEGGPSPLDSVETSPEPDLKEGSIVRIIRNPHFGKLAKVVALPEKPQKIITESEVNTIEIQLIDGNERIVFPRANVEPT